MLLNTVIEERERGFLFKNGKFARMLGPGAHFTPSFLGCKVARERIGDGELSAGAPIEIYSKDKAFMESTDRVDVPEGRLAIHRIDGKFVGLLNSGTHVFWNIFKRHTFTLLDPDDENAASLIPDDMLKALESLGTPLVIGEHERGFLYRHGRFVRMLLPGQHHIIKLLGYTCGAVRVTDGPITDKTLLAAAEGDENFASSIRRVEIPEGSIALHYVDGCYANTLTGTCAFWNIFQKHEFRIVDMSDDSSLADIPAKILEAMPDSVLMKVTVDDWQAALLFVDGAFVRRLPSGTHHFWRNGRNISCPTYEMRVRQIDVSGQEILTSDKVSLRVNFISSYRITDPVAMNANLFGYESQIYSAAQLALRELLGSMSFDEVLENRNSIAGRVLEILKKKEKELYVEFLSAGMKDIILPGEIRDIMNTVLAAEKKAQANVITRREEVASTRSLLNTARMMEENATLYKLKELEYLERICDKVGSINVSNAAGLLEQLRSMIRV
jgi:regulator of protease activity HflC (stomatin/prohibitin superfamily)